MNKKQALIKKLASGVIVAFAALVMAGVAAQGATGDATEAKVPGAGAVTGQTSAQIAQALLVGDVQVEGGHDSQVSISQDATYFEVHTKIVAGDRFALNIDLNNQSTTGTKARLTVNAPAEFTIAAGMYAGSQEVTDIVQINANTWEMVIHPTVADAQTKRPDLTIGVATPITLGAGKGDLAISITPVGTTG